MAEKDTEHKIYHLDKPVNRFYRLRFPDKLTDTTKPIVAGRTFADKYPISTGKISELENDQLQEYNPVTKERGDAPNCKASVLQIYHDMFGCSYDYLMGETNNTKIEYATIGKLPVLSEFDDSFWDNIREFAGEKYDSKQNIFMLSLLLSNPDEFDGLISFIVHELNKIHTIKTLKLPKESETASIGSIEYTLSSTFIRYLYKNVLPKMDSFFTYYEQQQEKIDKATQELYDETISLIFPL